MDGNRFDALARTLGAGRSRRGALKTLLGGALGGAAVVLGGAQTEAARSPKPPAPQCCPTNFPTLCGSPGTCTNTISDPAHCGSCSTACAVGGTCVNGACGCPAGQTACNGVCVNLSTDPNNCGSCGQACSFPNETPSCSNGTCVFGTCDSGFGNCDGNSSNGCETNLLTDNANCGSCHAACAVGGTCVNGACTCPAGQTACNGVCVNTNSDIGNCGSCSHACTASNGTPICNAGVCGIGSCSPGFADCNVSAADGCEVNTTNDSNNCGSCGNKCGTGQTCQNSFCVATGGADGQSCATGADCASTFCVNSVCCNTACTGTCQACSQVLTGAANGTCADVKNGTDPNDSCTDAGASSCGFNGLCQGGACAFYSSGTVCAAASCTGSTLTAQGTCNGNGSCVAGSQTSCGAYACNSAGTACNTTCASDQQCASGNFCNSGQCVPKFPSGGSCTTSNQCLSGSCVNTACS